MMKGAGQATRLDHSVGGQLVALRHLWGGNFPRYKSMIIEKWKMKNAAHQC